MIEVKFNNYTIRVTYTGDTASPMDKHNFNSHTIRITNDFTKQNSVLAFWSKPVVNASGALLAFYAKLQSCLFGALDPMQFAAFMNIDPQHKDLEQVFKLHRETAEKLKNIVIGRDELLKTIKMLEQALGIKPDPKAN